MKRRLLALPPALRRNLLPKVICGLLAVSLWLVVAAGGQRTGTFPGGVPITLENVPAGLVASLPEERVSIVLAAERSRWQQLSELSFRATVDLAGTTAGVVDRPVTVEARVDGVEVVEVAPRQILVRLEAEDTKQVPIDVRVTGDAAEGFVPGQATPEPATVQLRGPASQLATIDQVTAEVALDGDRTSLVKGARVVLPVHATGTDVSPAEVSVSVPILRASNVKSVGVVADATGSPPLGYSVAGIDVVPSVVSVVGTSTVLSQTSQLLTEPITLDDLRESAEIETHLVLPPELRLVEPVDGRIRVSVAVTQTLVQRSFEIPVRLVTLPTRLGVARLFPRGVELTLRGPSRTLTDLDPATLRFEVSVPGGFGSGTHDLPIEQTLVGLPDELEIVTVEPRTVTVELVEK